MTISLFLGALGWQFRAETGNTSLGPNFENLLYVRTCTVVLSDEYISERLNQPVLRELDTQPCPRAVLPGLSGSPGTSELAVDLPRPFGRVCSTRV